jgi:hypothetical protein
MAGIGTKGNRDDDSECTSCKKIVVEEGMQCERCFGWAHVECAKLDNKEYKLLKKTKSNLKWFCDACNEKYLDSKNSMKEMNIKNEKLELEIKCMKMEFMKEVIEIKKQLENKALKSEVLEMKNSLQKLDKEVSKPSWSEIVTKAVDDKFTYMAEDIGKVQEKVQETKLKMRESEEKIKEIEDKQRRKENVIIYNVEESKLEDVKERSKEDKNFCLEMMKEVLKVGSEEGDIVKVTRLGKREDGIRRPLLVNFKSEREKNLVMENAGKLWKAKDRFKGVTMSYDMTQKERTECRELVSEAKALQEGDHSGDWLYKVRGIPGAMRVVKMKKY